MRGLEADAGPGSGGERGSVREENRRRGPPEGAGDAPDTPRTQENQSREERRPKSEPALRAAGNRPRRR